MIASIFTSRRLAEMGHCALQPYMAVVVPDDLPQFSVWFETLDSLCEWVREMTPDSLEAHTAGRDAGEDADELIAFCRRGVATH